MKTGTIAVILASAIVVAGITYAFVRGTDEPAAPPLAAAVKPAAASKVVHVDDLAKRPDDFKGDIVLRGVVAGVKPSKGVFGIIDSREFESCGGVLTCAENILPVKFSGALPEPKAVVEITGRMVRGEKGLVIEANRVEAVQ